MKDSTGFQRIAAVSAILLTLFVLGNVITLFASVNNNVSVFSDAALLLPMGSRAARLFHLSMVFDVLGYLSFAPIALFCWIWLRRRNDAIVSLYTLCGLAYSLLGSLGAVILDAVLPRLMGEYAAASAAHQETLRVVAGAAYQAVAHGVWNPLEVLLVSLWFLGIGVFLWHENRWLGILALVVSLFGFLDPLGWVLSNEAILNIGGVGTALIPMWSLWFGIGLLRSPPLIPG